MSLGFGRQTHLKQMFCVHDWAQNSEQGADTKGKTMKSGWQTRKMRQTDKTVVSQYSETQSWVIIFIDEIQKV